MCTALLMIIFVTQNLRLSCFYKKMNLKINSANLVDIVLDVEEVFKIEIDNESMAKMLTVEATINIIKSKLNQQ